MSGKMHLLNICQNICYIYCNDGKVPLGRDSLAKKQLLQHPSQAHAIKLASIWMNICILTHDVLEVKHSTILFLETLGILDKVFDN